jgi:hypothetical protein
MNLNLLFNLKVNENLQENWLKFKNELTLLYTYYFEMSREECIGMFKLVQKTLSSEMLIEQHNEENLKQIKYVMRDIKEHLEYLRTYKEII